MQTITDLSYSNNTARANLFDLQCPDSSQPLPCVIHFHGGGWRMFGKYLPETEFLAKAGFCVVSANYHFAHEAHYPAQLEDIKTLVAHLQTNAAQYNIDPNQIFAWGISAGGHLAALLGALGLVQAAACVCAPTDFCKPQDWALEYANGAFDWLLGQRADTHPDLARAASPVYLVSSRSAPMLLLHGTQDNLVPIAQAQALQSALETHSISCQLEPIADGDHYINETHKDVLEQKIATFFSGQKL